MISSAIFLKHTLFFSLECQQGRCTLCIVLVTVFSTISHSQYPTDDRAEFFMYLSDDELLYLIIQPVTKLKNAYCLSFCTGRPGVTERLLVPDSCLSQGKYVLGCLWYAASLATKSVLSDRRQETSNSHSSSPSYILFFIVSVDSISPAWKVVIRLFFLNS